ncbi:MAG: 8-oxo-dGTP diphosphatase [Clostridia bacterium]|nr:8-oxo-dGTP diphosphatase [Clostridia bacterium]
MKETTLCYIENSGRYLMLHRIKKENDINHGKWIGIGGKLEECESPEECVVREIYEETNLKVYSLKYRGKVKFISDIYDDEIMHLYTANSETDCISVCNEGELKWIPKEDVLSLNLWEGDKVFLEYLLNGHKDFFEISLIYKGESLFEVIKE